MDNKLVVGIADMKMTRQDGMLITYALGSCIGVCLYDPTIRLAALVHIMLPLNMGAGRKSPMKKQGGMRSRIVAKIAGGARMFDVGGSGSLGNIGQRNIESTHIVLRREGIRLLREDVGGSVARTLLFDAASGQACVRSYGKPELIF